MDLKPHIKKKDKTRKTYNKLKKNLVSLNNMEKWGEEEEKVFVDSFKEIKEMCYYSCSCCCSSSFDCCYCGGDDFWIRGVSFVFKNSKQAAFNECACVLCNNLVIVVVVVDEEVEEL